MMEPSVTFSCQEVPFSRAPRHMLERIAAGVTSGTYSDTHPDETEIARAIAARFLRERGR